jgi:hypothetical protein
VFAQSFRWVDPQLALGKVAAILRPGGRLLLDPTAQAELRSRLSQRIGTAGVDAQNDALAVVCVPTAAR